MTLFRLLLKLYPARFREEYAGQLERHFNDEYRDAHSVWKRARFWAQALADLAVSIPREFAREMSQDLRYASRVYRQQKFVTALALAALAMAIGATTGIFSVVNALLLRELPFREPGRLVEVFGSSLNSFEGPAVFREHREQAREYLEDGAMFTTNLMNLERAGAALRVRVTETSANFFSLLGSEPVLGRAFLADEDDPTRNQVAILSHRLWQQNFGADSRVLGSSLAVNGTPLTVIGIAPAAFDFPAQTDVWTPTALEFSKVPKSAYFSQAIGRVKPGLTLAQARARFETVLRREDPKWFEMDAANRPRLTPLRDQLAGPIRGAALVLFATVALVLLIACANVAQLLLARLNERRQELAVRAALGASRARLIQQLAAEAMVLTVSAAAIGLLVAHWTTQLAAVFEPAPLAVQAYTILDGRVLGFAVAVALLAGLVFGVLPAFAMGRLQPSQAILGSRAAGAGVARMRKGLVAVQAALTVILLAGSVTLGRGFLKLLATDLGFRTAQVVTLSVSLDGTRHSVRPAQAQYYRDVIEKLRGVPGVEAAGAVTNLPLEKYTMYSGGVPMLDTGQKASLTMSNSASSGYFEAMRQDLIAGRDFSDAERRGMEAAVLVNEEFARSVGLGPNVVGRRIQGKQAATIVGLVRSARIGGPASQPQAEVYRPIERMMPGFATFVARVRGDAASYIPVLRDAARVVDPAVPLYDIKLLEARLTENLARPRFYTTAILFLGGFALLLAAIGIYGVASHSVAQRTKEIGVRIAVGASAGGVRAMLLRQSMMPLMVGLVMGSAGAIALGRFLQSLMGSADPVGAWTAASAGAVLVVACAAAVWRATARVVRLDPIQVLRSE